jgi:SsrA-binding protein
LADIATNRQARFRYHFLETWEAGVVLTGTEVKSLREGKAQIKDGYASVKDGEVWLHNVHIPPYAPASRENHEPERSRKLLMHRREIERLIGKTREKGLTLVPTRLYFRDGRVKVYGCSPGCLLMSLLVSVVLTILVNLLIRAF